MKYLEIVALEGSAKTIRKLAEQEKLPEPRMSIVGEDGRQTMRLIVPDDRVQPVLDILQKLFGSQRQASVAILDIEAVLTTDEQGKLSRQSSKKNNRKKSKLRGVTRESLYAEVSGSVYPSADYFVLVVLSTIVAGIGLIENNVAVVIGAMVIAPLLGPNLALTLGVTLGDGRLIRRAGVTLMWGMLVVFAMSMSGGLFLGIDTYSSELLSRTDVGAAAVALALASGAAGALSLTAGVSSVLVGVMVAVALLPPAVTCGLMLGQGAMHYASGAALLLGVNIVCVNLAALAVFFAKGVTPNTWEEKNKAKDRVRIYATGWGVLLAGLCLLTYYRAQWY